jgi:hypothetical protein
MKAWLDLKSVALPLRMRALARDARGYPIPFNVAIGTDGVPSFKVQDVAKISYCLKFRACAICGKRMSRELAFVGGPLSIANRMFTDPAMHADCARYALRVCPMLAAPSFAYARRTGDVAGHVPNVESDLVSTERPDRFGLGVTHDFELVELQGELVIRAEPFEAVEWWRGGQRLPDPPPQGKDAP